MCSRLLVLFSLLGLVLTGCARDESGKTLGKTPEKAVEKAEPVPGVTPDEIVIGNIQDLSGPLKELGYLLPAGADLVFQQVNEQGGVHGRKIRMLVEDHGYNPQKAVMMAKKLIDRDRVFTLFQVIGTSVCEAVAPILAEYAIPLVAPATQSGTMSDPTREYIFHTDTGYDKQAVILVDYILKQDAEARIGLVYQDDDYGMNVIKGIKEAEARHGITVQKEAYQPGAADFAGQVANMNKGRATHVIIAGVVKEPIIILKTAAAMDFKPQFLGMSPTLDHRVPKAAGPAGEGYIASAIFPLWNSDDKGPTLYRKLHDRYADKEKHQQGMYSYYGFASAHVLVEALKAAGRDLTREGFMEALNSLSYTGGGFPDFTWSRDRHSSAGSVMLIQVKDGKQKQLTDWIK